MRTLLLVLPISGFHGFKPCPDCGKIKQRGVYIIEERWEDKLNFIGCLECNPVMDDDENIWGGDKVCHDCFLEWGKKRKKNDNKKNDLLTKLIKENQELRHQLTEVQKQLAEVLAELKKLKNNLTTKDSKWLELECQISQNERLIKEDEKVSVVEFQEQISKSQSLVQEVKNISTAVPVKNGEEKKRDNSDLVPFLTGSLIVIISGLVFTGYLLVRKRNKRKKMKN